MEKVVVFLDFANINRAALDAGFKLDYKQLLDYVVGGRFLVDAFAYVPLNPHNEHSHDRDIENLWLNNYQVTTKTGTFKNNSYKCDFDIEITMDILNTIYKIKPDTIIILSGDVDFVPVLKEIRSQGIRAEVGAFTDSVVREIILKSSGFISLNSMIDSYPEIDEYYEEEFLEDDDGMENSFFNPDNSQQPVVDILENRDEGLEKYVILEGKDFPDD